MCILLCLYADIDECAGVNDCQQMCSNTQGSFECSCQHGFLLDDNGKSCTRTLDKNACQLCVSHLNEKLFDWSMQPIVPVPETNHVLLGVQSLVEWRSVIALLVLSLLEILSVKVRGSIPSNYATFMII